MFLCTLCSYFGDICDACDQKLESETPFPVHMLLHLMATSGKFSTRTESQLSFGPDTGHTKNKQKCEGKKFKMQVKCSYKNVNVIKSISFMGPFLTKNKSKNL